MCKLWLCYMFNFDPQKFWLVFLSSYDVTFGRFWVLEQSFSVINTLSDSQNEIA